MRIKFTGYMDIPAGEEPDDRGSVDLWLTNFIRDSAITAKEEGDFNYNEGDTLFEKLQMNWEVVP